MPFVAATKLSLPTRFQLVSAYQASSEQVISANQLVKNLNQQVSDQILLGVTGSGKTFTIAKVIEKVQRPTLVMAPNKTLAAQLYNEFKQFFPHNAVEYFVSYYDYYQPEAYNPVSDTYIEKDAAINDYIEQMRLAAVKALLSRRDTIIVSSVSAIYGLGDPEDYLKLRLIVSLGEKITASQITKQLVDLQYLRNETDFHRGTYRVKGEIIDIFPAENDTDALRIELFDGIVETITVFDALLGTTKQVLNRTVVYPATHYVSSHDNKELALETIKLELTERLAELTKDDKLVEAQRLRERTNYDVEMIKEIGYCKGIENYSRHLTGRAPGAPPPTLFDYLPKDALLVLDESHVTAPQIGAMYKGDHSRKESLVNFGFRLPSAMDNRPLTFAEWELIKPPTIFVSATPGKYEKQQSGIDVVEQIIRPTGLLDPELEVRPALNQVDDLLSEVHERIAWGDRVLITTLTKRMAENLTDFLVEQDIKAKYLHSDIDTLERTEIIRQLRLGEFDVLVGINLLREGLDLPEVSLVAILDADKEGFLRSANSLIQTIGRAARNARGKVLLYGDITTHSMQVAITETDRRREIQRQYNLVHHLTPQTITTQVGKVMATPSKQAHKSGQPTIKANWDKLGVPEMGAVPLASLTLEQGEKLVTKLQRQMLIFAKNLEFEQAAFLRDELAKVKQQLLKS